jgi:hypothetical protein
MRKLLISATAIALAGPALAQAQAPGASQGRPPAHSRAPHRQSEEDRRLSDEVRRSVPGAAETREAAETVDRVVGAVLDVPIGPIVDAVDPQRRQSRSGRSNETVRDMASRDDPHFEEKVRGSIHGMTANMGAVMEQIAVVAPIMRRTMEEIERSVDTAIRDSRVRRSAPEDRDPGGRR